MKKVFVLLVASLIVILTISLMFTSVASAQPPHGCEDHESFSCTFGESPDPCDQFDGYQCDDGWSLNCDYACSVANHCNYFAIAKNCNEDDGWYPDGANAEEYRDYDCSAVTKQCEYSVTDHRCNEGYKNCDGDWSNGCECSKECCGPGTPNALACYNPANPENGCCAYASCYDGTHPPDKCTTCYGGSWHSGWDCEGGECVPEASTLVLLATGLLFLVGYLGLRRKEN